MLASGTAVTETLSAMSNHHSTDGSPKDIPLIQQSRRNRRTLRAREHNGRINGLHSIGTCALISLEVRFILSHCYIEVPQFNLIPPARASTKVDTRVAFHSYHQILQYKFIAIPTFSSSLHLASTPFQ